MSDHVWILSVCDDLKEYANRNSLNLLATAIDNTKNIAIWELHGMAELPLPASVCAVQQPLDRALAISEPSAKIIDFPAN